MFKIKDLDNTDFKSRMIKMAKHSAYDMNILYSESFETLEEQRKDIIEKFIQETGFEKLGFYEDVQQSFKRYLFARDAIGLPLIDNMFHDNIMNKNNKNNYIADYEILEEHENQYCTQITLKWEGKYIYILAYKHNKNQG
jgi:hypothetical protein